MTLYVNVCICIAPGAEADYDRLRRDFLCAEDIWYPIRFSVTRIVRLSSSYIFADREISYLTPFTEQPKVNRLMNHSTALSPRADIYVCYVGGDYFREENVIACACSRVSNGILKGFIVITNGAASHSNLYTLAHELGHILLTRREQGVWTNSDPDCPDGGVHHPNSHNLMHPIIPSPKSWRHPEDLITSNQRRTALRSPLLKEKSNRR